MKKKIGLAIHGGEKTRKRPMPPRKALGKSELNAVKEVFSYYGAKGLDAGYQGRYEELYCREFVRYVGEKGFADAVATGTAALYIAVAALRLKAGDHVIVSPVTDPGTINAVILNGLVPVLADSYPGSYNIGAGEFTERITDKTRAVIVVHVGGSAAPVDKISAIAKKKGIYVIEDCSQSHGAEIKGRKVGTFGDMAAFSTMYRKAHATGGCGGVVYTKNRKFYKMIRACADRGKPFFRKDFNEKDPSSFLFPALNLNIDEISCAIGISSLRKIESIRKRRVGFLKYLGSLMEKYSKVCRIAEVSSDDSPFFHPILLDTSGISCSKIKFAQAIKAEGIDINPDYRYAVREWEWARPYLYDDFICRNAVDFRKNSFNLLFNENYGKTEAADIVNAVVKVERKYGQ